MTTVLIVGASQGIGLETVRKALDAGYYVRALARSAKNIEIEHTHLTKIPASATDAIAVQEAVKDCDAVITTLGISITFQPVSFFSDSMRIILDAMTESGVKRLIAVTGLGAGDSQNSGGPLVTKVLRPFFLGTIYEDKTREEELIQASTVDWTIVRPGILTRLPEKGGYQVLTERKTWKTGFISRADVADFLVTQVEDTDYVGKTPVLIY